MQFSPTIANEFCPQSKFYATLYERCCSVHLHTKFTQQQMERTAHNDERKESDWNIWWFPESSGNFSYVCRCMAFCRIERSHKNRLVMKELILSEDCGIFDVYHKFQTIQNDTGCHLIVVEINFRIFKINSSMSSKFYWQRKINSFNESI